MIEPYLFDFRVCDLRREGISEGVCVCLREREGREEEIGRSKDQKENDQRISLL